MAIAIFTGVVFAGQRWEWGLLALAKQIPSSFPPRVDICRKTGCWIQQKLALKTNEKQSGHPYEDDPEWLYPNGVFRRLPASASHKRLLTNSAISLVTYGGG